MLFIILHLYHILIIMLITLNIIIYLQLNIILSLIYIVVLVFNLLFYSLHKLQDLENYILYHQIIFESNWE